MNNEGYQVFCPYCGGEVQIGDTHCIHCNSNLPERLIVGKPSKNTNFQADRFGEISKEPMLEEVAKVAESKGTTNKVYRESGRFGSNKRKYFSMFLMLVLGAAVAVLIMFFIGQVKLYDKDNEISEMAKRIDSQTSELETLKAESNSQIEEIRQLEEDVKVKESTLSKRDSTIKELQSTLDKKNSEISDLQKKVNSLTLQSVAYIKIRDTVKNGNIGYASQALHANQGIVYLKKNGDAKNIQVTWDVNINKTLYWQCDDMNVVVPEWDMKWNNHVTGLVVSPREKGVAIVRIYNDLNSEEFHIIVIVS